MQKTEIYDFIGIMATMIGAEERKKCTELGLRLVHFQVLDYLMRCNKYSNTPAATAKYLGMTRGTISQSLMILEKRGYIEKVSDASDKRVIHLMLLPEGIKNFKLYQAIHIILQSRSYSGRKRSFPK